METKPHSTQETAQQFTLQIIGLLTQWRHGIVTIVLAAIAAVTIIAYAYSPQAYKQATIRHQQHEIKQLRTEVTQLRQRQRILYRVTDLTYFE